MIPSRRVAGTDIRPPRATVTEAAFTRQVLDLARLMGWRVAHFRGSNGARLANADVGRRRLPGSHPRPRRRPGRRRVEVRSQPTDARADGMARRVPPCGVVAVVWTPSDWSEIEAAC